MNDLRLVRASIALGSLLFFLASLFLPAIHAGSMAVHGGHLLAMGWLGVIYGGFGAWVANPVYVLALLLFVFRQDRWAAPCALLALLIGLDSLRLDSWRVDEKPVPIDHFGIGFHAWIAAIVILVVGAFVVGFLSRKARKRDASA